MGLSLAHLIYAPAIAASIAYATVQARSEFAMPWWQAYLMGINVVAFAVFAADKVLVRILRVLRLRVPEDILIWELAFPGGILGALMAMYLFDHKTGPDTYNFRMALVKAYAILVTLIFIAYRWTNLSLSRMDPIVENVVSLVLNAVETLVTTVRTS